MEDSVSKSELEEAKAQVHGYIDAMNQWEINMDCRSRYDEGKTVSRPELCKEALRMTRGELDKQYYAILEQYCTQRKRVYGGHPLSFSKPPRYDGMSQFEFHEIRQPKPGRIELVAKGGNFPDRFTMFVVFKRRGHWLIDNLKTCHERWYGQWDVDYL